MRLQGAWALELVRTATWLGNFSFVVGRMTVVKMTKKRMIFLLRLFNL